MLFVGEGPQAAPPRLPPLLGPWVCGWITVVLGGQQRLFCSVKEAEPITPRRSQHEELCSPTKTKRIKCAATQIIFLRELTLSVTSSPPHSYRRTFLASSAFSLSSCCSASGCQPQSLSELLIIKYSLLFTSEDCKSQLTLLKLLSGARKINKGISCTDIQPRFVLVSFLESSTLYNEWELLAAKACCVMSPEARFFTEET